MNSSSESIVVSGGVLSVSGGRLSRLVSTALLCFLLLVAVSIFPVAFLFRDWEDVVNARTMLSADLVTTRSRHELQCNKIEAKSDKH